MNKVELNIVILLMLVTFCLGIATVYFYFVLKYGPSLAYLDALKRTGVSMGGLK
jgi:flagellar basal body-associated protein FliL